MEALDLVAGGGLIKRAFWSHFYGRRDPVKTGGGDCWGLLFVIFWNRVVERTHQSAASVSPRDS